MRDLLAALWSFRGIDLDCVARLGMRIYKEGELFLERRVPMQGNSLCNAPRVFVFVPKLSEPCDYAAAGM